MALTGVLDVGDGDVVVDGALERAGNLGVEFQPLVLEGGQGLADRLGLALAGPAVDHQPRPGAGALVEGVDLDQGPQLLRDPGAHRGLLDLQVGMGRAPVEVVQPPLAGRHGGVLAGGDERGRSEAAAGQPPPGPALPGLPVRRQPGKERRQAAGGLPARCGARGHYSSSSSGIDSMLVARSRSPSVRPGLAARRGPRAVQHAGRVDRRRGPGPVHRDRGRSLPVHGWRPARRR